MRQDILTSKVRGITEILCCLILRVLILRLKKRAKTEYGLIAQPVRASA